MIKAVTMGNTDACHRLLALANYSSNTVTLFLYLIILCELAIEHKETFSNLTCKVFLSDCILLGANILQECEL